MYYNLEGLEWVTKLKTSGDLGGQLHSVWRSYKQTGDQALRDKLILHYLPFVKSHVKRIRGKISSEVPTEDMMSDAICGMLSAMRKFDPGRGFKFETFAAFKIKGAIEDGLRDRDLVPRLVRSRAKTLKNVKQDFYKREGRLPSDEEARAELGLSDKDYQKIHKDSVPRETTSLHAVIRKDKPVMLFSLVGDKTSKAPPEEVDEHLLKEVIIHRLSRQERIIVILYYYNRLTLKEVSKVLELHESRVSQIHTGLLKRLRRRFEEEGRTL